MFSFMKSSEAKKYKFCALNLYKMKVYDHVKWSYIKEIMDKRGFNRYWVTVIMCMVSSVLSQLCLMGNEFKPSRVSAKKILFNTMFSCWNQRAFFASYELMFSHLILSVL